MNNANSSNTRIAITAGEPAGVGPDLCIQLAQMQHKYPNSQLVVVADPSILAARAKILDIKIKLIEFQSNNYLPAENNSLIVYPLSAKTKVTPRILDSANSKYVIDSINLAVTKCQQKIFDALVTAPVHKGIINTAGINFVGHTEFLAELTQAKHVAMMFTSTVTKLALATRHIPVAKIATAINQQDLTATLKLLHNNLRQQYNIANPKIAVCGLNPHAGEGGNLGSEEITTIIPVIEQLKVAGMQLYGPLAADSVFTPKWFKKIDLILAMYHDQGLAAFKAVCFGKSANVTVGLPIIRTSVDHGTALDIAASGKVEAGSFLTAIDQAIILARNFNRSL